MGETIAGKQDGSSMIIYGSLVTQDLTYKPPELQKYKKLHNLYSYFFILTELLDI